MGWNGSGQKGAAPVQPKVTTKKPSPIRGLVAGAVVVALVAVAYFVFFSGSEKPQAEKARKQERIKAVTPAAAPTNKVAETKKPIDPKEDYDHERMYRDEKGILRYKTGCRAPDHTRPRSKPLKASSLSKPSPFTNGFERALCSLVTHKPGSMRLARRNYYDADFQAEFTDSLLKPIVISPDDTPRNRRLKEAVQEAKKEVIARIKNGENLGDILTEAENSLSRLREYKRNLEKAVGDTIERGSLSTEEVKDLVKAANAMFEKEGLAPISDDSFVRWNLRLGAEREGANPDEAEAAYDAARAKEKETKAKENEK